ncbi:MAG: hypothetical protein JWO37_2233 [Acidimicrobiales bacterium]|jgi:uncharacterized repeat protein (TIGR03843 family)|nr:hypothetical protein [Acidimicrobiales bacterium]
MDATRLLTEGAVEMKGRMPWSSNATFLVELCLDGAVDMAVYKPERGERPLWDYPPGLWRREVAAYLVSEALGWGVVPETVERVDGPLGHGSLQRFVPADFDQHYFTLLERPEHVDALKTIATFDLVINNADRKGGHCLLGDDGRVWAVDQGLCFSATPALRTVMWDFAGEPIPEPLIGPLARLAMRPPDTLADHLDDEEIDALARRAAAVVDRPEFPNPRSNRSFPWPLV